MQNLQRQIDNTCLQQKTETEIRNQFNCEILGLLKSMKITTSALSAATQQINAHDPMLDSRQVNINSTNGAKEHDINQFITQCHLTTKLNCHVTSDCAADRRLAHLHTTNSSDYSASFHPNMRMSMQHEFSNGNSNATNPVNSTRQNQSTNDPNCNHNVNYSNFNSTEKTTNEQYLLPGNYVHSTSNIHLSVPSTTAPIIEPHNGIRNVQLSHAYLSQSPQNNENLFQKQLMKINENSLHMSNDAPECQV